MNTPTPRTDAETTLMTLDCDDSCVEIYLKRDGKVVEGDFVLADFARKLERERDEARAQLYRICCEGFDNQDTIGLEPADDYVLRKLAELKAERDLARERGFDMSDVLSIAEADRDHYRRENGKMREAINEASKRLQSIQLNDIFEETMRYNAALALAKLKPFLK